MKRGLPLHRLFDGGHRFIAAAELAERTREVGVGDEYLGVQLDREPQLVDGLFVVAVEKERGPEHLLGSLELRVELDCAARRRYRLFERTALKMRERKRLVSDREPKPLRRRT